MISAVTVFGVVVLLRVMSGRNWMDARGNVDYPDMFDDHGRRC